MTQRSRCAAWLHRGPARSISRCPAHDVFAHHSPAPLRWCTPRRLHYTVTKSRIALPTTHHTGPHHRRCRRCGKRSAGRDRGDGERLEVRAGVAQRGARGHTRSVSARPAVDRPCPAGGAARCLSTRRPTASAPPRRLDFAHASRLGVATYIVRRQAALERLLVRLRTVAPNRWAIKGGLALDTRFGARARARPSTSMWTMPSASTRRGGTCSAPASSPLEITSPSPSRDRTP